METTQLSFSGGMNLLVDDTRLGDNEYLEGFNIRNRFDVLDGVREAVEDVYAPAGIKQGMFTFEDYIFLFCNGLAYYKRRGDTGWIKVNGYYMSETASRVYVVAVPVGTALHARELDGFDDVGGPLLTTPMSTAGNLSGILIQDGVNQSQFIWANEYGQMRCRTTHKFEDWFYDSTDVADNREYVPVGTFMEWCGNILYIVSPDRRVLYRSVSGRPLDFVVNVDKDGNKGGDATTTAYSVGVGKITCIKSLSTGGLFVAAANRYCYEVTPNFEKTLFGEPTFKRTYLFDSGCVNDRCFVDILGDFAFIDPEGLRSYNSVQQLQSEGRNSVFSLKVAALFKGLLQTESSVCAISYDNYALFGVNTLYGHVILVYDTLNKCFVGMDTQTNGVGLKQFAKIDTDVTELYALTTDDHVLKLYSGTEYATSTVRLKSACSQNPKQEIQPVELRCVLSEYWLNSTVSCTSFVDNRVNGEKMTKALEYVAPVKTYSDTPAFADIGSQVSCLFFNWIGSAHGWKTNFVLSWTGGGTITSIQSTHVEVTPMNSLHARSLDASNV